MFSICVSKSLALEAEKEGRKKTTGREKAQKSTEKEEENNGRRVENEAVGAAEHLEKEIIL